MTVKLSGTIRIPRARHAELLPLLDDHVAASRSEPGCRHFTISADHHDPELFHLSEEFDDEAAFVHHQTRGWNSPWGPAAKDLKRHITKTIS